MSSSSAEVSRPVTAYFLWYNENRSKIMKEHKLTSVTETTKKGSELWKALSAAEKKPFEDKYAEAKVAWDKVQEGKKAELNAKLNPEGSKKKPQCPYFLWLNENRAKIMEEHKLTGVTEFTKKGSELWKALSEADKKPYEDKYAAAKKEYEAYASSDAGKAILQQQKDAKKEVKDEKNDKKKKKEAKAAKAEAKLAKEDGDADMEEAAEADKADKADNCPPQKSKREPKAAQKPKEPKADAEEQKPSKKRGRKGDGEEPANKKVKPAPKPKPRKGEVSELSEEILKQCKALGATANEVPYAPILAKLLATADLEITEEDGLEALKKNDGNLNKTRVALRAAA